MPSKVIEAVAADELPILESYCDQNRKHDDILKESSSHILKFDGRAPEQNIGQDEVIVLSEQASSRAHNTK